MNASPSHRHPFAPANLALMLMPPLFWAGNAVIARAMAPELAPLALSFWRWAIALLVILPFTASDIWASRAIIRRSWPVLVALGIAGIGVYNSCQYLALQTTAAINVTLLASSAPVFILLTGALFFGSPASYRQMAGAAVSIVGVLWVIGRGDVDRIMALHLAAGDAYILFAIAVWSFYTWLLRTRRPPLAPATFLAVQIAIGTVGILPFYVAEWVLSPRPIILDTPVIATLAYVGILPSLAAYFCWDRAVARVGAAIPSYFVNITPLFAALLAWLFLGESIHPYHLVATVLIFLGITLATSSRPKVSPA